MLFFLKKKHTNQNKIKSIFVRHHKVKEHDTRPTTVIHKYTHDTNFIQLKTIVMFRFSILALDRPYETIDKWIKISLVRYLKIRKRRNETNARDYVYCVSIVNWAENLPE